MTLEEYEAALDADTTFNDVDLYLAFDPPESSAKRRVLWRYVLGTQEGWCASKVHTTGATNGECIKLRPTVVALVDAHEDIRCEDIASVRNKVHRLFDRLSADSPRTVRRHNAYSTPARPVPRIGHRI